MTFINLGVLPLYGCVCVCMLYIFTKNKMCGKRDLNVLYKKKKKRP